MVKILIGLNKFWKIKEHYKSTLLGYLSVSVSISDLLGIVNLKKQFEVCVNFRIIYKVFWFWRRKLVQKPFDYLNIANLEIKLEKVFVFFKKSKHKIFLNTKVENFQFDAVFYSLICRYFKPLKNWILELQFLAQKFAIDYNFYVKFISNQKLEILDLIALCHNVTQIIRFSLFYF